MDLPAALVALLERKVFVQLWDLGGDLVATAAVFLDAGMERVTEVTWAPGPSTLAWVIRTKFPQLKEAMC